MLIVIVSDNRVTFIRNRIPTQRTRPLRQLSVYYFFCIFPSALPKNTTAVRAQANENTESDIINAVQRF